MGGCTRSYRDVRDPGETCGREMRTHSLLVPLLLPRRITSSRSGGRSQQQTIEGQSSTGHLWESLGPWGCDTASRPLVLRSLVDSLLPGIQLVYPVELIATRDTFQILTRVTRNSSQQSSPPQSQSHLAIDPSTSNMAHPIPSPLVVDPPLLREVESRPPLSRLARVNASLDVRVVEEGASLRRVPQSFPFSVETERLEVDVGEARGGS
jgi:hypothetical protein